MKHVFGAIVFAAVLGCTTAPAGSAPDVDRIQTLYTDWRAAVENGDIPAYVASLAEDVRLLPPGAAPIVGANTYGKFLEPVFETATYRIEVVRPPSVEVIGGLAFAEYEYVIHLDLKNPDQGITEPGALTASRSQLQYFDVLKQQADGAWRVWRHTWRDSPPPTD